MEPALILAGQYWTQFFLYGDVHVAWLRLCILFAIIALARRERFSTLPVSALIVVLAIVALIVGAMVLLSKHMEGR